MKTAYPKTLLIAFENITPPNPVDFSTSMRDMAYRYKNRSYKIKPYHLHPGNEVARAQIVKDLNYLYECPSPMGTALVAKRFGVGFKGMRFV